MLEKYTIFIKGCFDILAVGFVKYLDSYVSKSQTKTKLDSSVIQYPELDTSIHKMTKLDKWARIWEVRTYFWLRDLYADKARYKFQL